MNTSVVTGSLASVAENNHQTLAESFLTADAIVIVDVSGSMAAADAPGGRTRYQMACDELARVQRDLPGKVAVVAFSSTVQFVSGGVPPFEAASTNLGDALRFVQPADGCVKFVVISDGMPDSTEDALNVARKFESEISCIYTGPESDQSGQQFLRQLARTAKGKYAERLKTAGLGAEVTKMLRAG